MRLLLDIVTTVSIGLMIGAELAVSAFIHPILRHLETPARINAVRLFARGLGSAMPFWYSLNLVLLIFECVLRRGETGEPCLIAAGAIWIVVIVLTLIFLVPINNRVARSEMPADAFLRLHAQWDRRHRARVVALTGAMVCFLIAILTVR